MPNNKKKSSSKKKGGGGAKASSPTSAAAINRLESLEIRCSLETAAELESLFQRDYPPSIDYDEFLALRSNKQRKKDETAYIRVATLFSQGIQFTQVSSKIPGISRWHLVTEKQMDALDVLIKSRPCPSDCPLCEILSITKTRMPSVCLF